MNTGLLIAVVAIVSIAVGVGLTVLVFTVIRRNEEADRAITAPLPDGVIELLNVLEVPAIILDPSQNVVATSPGALALGLVNNERLARPELIELADDLRDEPTDISRDLEVARGFGEATMTLSARASRFGAKYTLLLIADKTEFRRLEEVRRDFVANISHELKTPIGAVGLLAEALQEAAEDPEMVKKFADRLSNEAARLARITREIIDLSRLQMEDAMSNNELISIDTVVAKAVDQNKVVALAKAVDLAVGGIENAHVYGNENQLVMAVNNLISNAVQYSPPASRVGIGVAARDGLVEIAVTDQGIGMTPEESERVFERFYRTDQARSRSTGGTGLGLSIVKHTVANHGGEVKVWSRPGSGSTFTLRLPDAANATEESDS